MNDQSASSLFVARVASGGFAGRLLTDERLLLERVAVAGFCGLDHVLVFWLVELVDILHHVRHSLGNLQRYE